MIIGSMKEVFLTRAKQIFLFDCRVAGWDTQAINMYEDVLSSFICFAGNIQVRELTPDHILMYFANMADGPGEGEEHDRLVMSQYAIIQMWIYWMYSQKLITERTSGFVKPPRLIDIFPFQFARSLAYPGRTGLA